MTYLSLLLLFLALCWPIANAGGVYVGVTGVQAFVLLAALFTAVASMLYESRRVRPTL